MMFSECTITASILRPSNNAILCLFLKNLALLPIIPILVMYLLSYFLCLLILSDFMSRAALCDRFSAVITLHRMVTDQG